MGKYEILAGGAGILSLISFSSLIQNVYETHSTSSLPWTWVISNTIAILLSFIYGIANGAYGIYLPNILFLVGITYIFYVKLYFKQDDKDTKKDTNKINNM